MSDPSPGWLAVASIILNACFVPTILGDTYWQVQSFWQTNFLVNALPALCAVASVLPPARRRLQKWLYGTAALVNVAWSREASRLSRTRLLTHGLCTDAHAVLAVPGR